MDASLAIVVSLHLCAAVSLGSLAHVAASVRPLPRPNMGARGMARELALRSLAFALVEPLLRWLGAMMPALMPAGLRDLAERLVARGGTVAGLDADELTALCSFCAAAALMAAVWLGLPPWLGACVTLAGAGMPVMQVREKARAYQRVIARELPTAIDVMALSMGAGLGFAAALDLATREAVAPDSPLGMELTRVRQAIATGQSRKAALEGLSERVPCETVRDFAASVIQGELKGSPLASILEIQARTLRTRRAVAAEEAAARASVMLVLPLLLLLAAVMLLLFGPFMVSGMGM